MGVTEAVHWSKSYLKERAPSGWKA